MSKTATKPLLSSKWVQIVIIALIFAALIIARHIVGGFMFSLGYLYVGLISLSGFWFGIRGGVIAALIAAAIFVVEILTLHDLVARDVALNGIYLRFTVYLFAGIILGYLSQARQRRTETIEKLDDQKNIFMGMAAHDLRNPLSSIALTSYMLLEDIEEKPPSSDKMKMTLEAIHGTSGRMLMLIDDLLDITSIEAGKLDLKCTPCNYMDLVEHNAELNRIIAKGDDVEIVVDAANDLPEISIDAAKIDQVLNNLLGNAIKFAPPKTSIAVSVKTTSDGVMTQVIDEGPGISSEDMPHIFDPFYRSELSGAKKRSTGLGLAIVKHIVEAHGGRIWAESKPGKGATFTFTLPAERAR